MWCELQAPMRNQLQFAFCDQLLVLSDTRLGGKDVVALALSINNSSIECFNLFHNRINGECAVTLAKTLQGNTTLKELQLDGNLFSDVGAMAMASYMNNGSLERLGLGCNQIKDEGAVALAKALRGNNTLKVLLLHNNAIGVVGAVAFAVALLQSNTAIESIYDFGYDDNHVHRFIRFMLRFDRRRLSLDTYLKPYILEKVARSPDLLYHIIKGNPAAWINID